MNMLLKAYHSLLADIVELSGVQLDPPDDLTMQWIVSDGPKLDKELLRYMEELPDKHLPINLIVDKQTPGLLPSDSSREDSFWGPPSLPDWLMPLWLEYTRIGDVRVIGYLRQALVFCYKVEFEPTNEQRDTAEMQFLETDETVGVWNSWFKTQAPDPMFRSARQILSSIIYRVDWQNITPSHGPGAVFPTKLPSEKSNFCSNYRTIETYYDCSFFDGILGAVMPSYSSKIAAETYVDRDDIICNLVMVPKDSRGPRLICVHPAEAVWIQQGQRRALEKSIMSNPEVYKSIALDDQSINGNMALKSSLDRSHCTIDLKEASDRIGCELIKFLLGETYGIASCARASKVRIRNRVHTLQKWAPMGNCLTFPVQSLVFYSLVRAGIRVKYGVDCTDIYVFGDDIIVPSMYYEGALRGLLPCGLLPNVSKTFRRGFFRESCGVDAYHGVDITPHRLKRYDASTYSGAVSLCALAKNLRKSGYKFCSSFLYSEVSKRYGKLHLSNNFDTQGIYEWVETISEVFQYEPTLRFNRRWQRWEVRCILVEPTLSKLHKHDWYHVQDSLLRLARMGKMESDRGTEYAIPYRERLTYGWTPVAMPQVCQ